MNLQPQCTSPTSEGRAVTAWHGLYELQGVIPALLHPSSAPHVVLAAVNCIFVSGEREVEHGRLHDFCDAGTVDVDNDLNNVGGRE